jgi:predicted PurR-regulated permease PerM
MMDSRQSGNLLRLLTVSAAILAALGLIFVLHWARGLLVPLVVGILLSYVLEPPVATLAAWGVPRGIGACAVVALMIAALTARLPGAAQELRETIQAKIVDRPNPVAQIQRAADELHQMSASTPAPTGQTVGTVEVLQKPFDVGDFLWSSSTSVAGVVADGVVVLFLALYLLVAGDLFRRRLVEIAGPTLTEKKITLQILDNISEQISRYLFVRCLISAIVAVATGLGLWAIGLTQPAAWGLVAGILNIIPYVGPLAVTAAIGLAAFLQFHVFTMVGAAVGVTILIALTEAYAITPLLTSRAAEMNAAALFIGLVFWGWLWGLPGLFLAVPLIMVFKAILEHVDTFRPVLAFLKR